MESSSNTLSQANSPLQEEQNQVQEERMVIGAEAAPRVVLPALTEEEKRSDYVDNSFFTKKGILVQFVNSSCPGSTSMIGGIRLNLEDVRKAPAYLTKYKQQIKSHGIKFLTTHFQSMQCCIGATETLAPEDYGMSFSVASMSMQGTLLNPNKRHEGPLFYCLFPALIQPVLLCSEHWEYGIAHDEAYVLNAYINLLPKNQRRSHVILQAREEHALAEASKAAPGYAATLAKKSKFSPQASTPNKVHPMAVKAANEKSAMLDEIHHLRKEMDKMKRAPLQSPHLPKTKPLVWPAKDTCPELPAEL